MSFKEKGELSTHFNEFSSFTKLYFENLGKFRVDKNDFIDTLKYVDNLKFYRGFLNRQ